MKMSKALMLAVTALAVTACDPYEGSPGGAPRVLSYIGVNDDHPYEAAEPTAEGEPWVINGVPSGSTVFFVKTNKLMDGASIQATPRNCSPTGITVDETTNAATGGTGWLTVNGTAVAPDSWMTCYNPSSPAAGEYSSAVIFRGGNPTGGSAGEGWFDTADVPAGIYEFGGSFADKGGTELPIDLLAAVADPVTQDLNGNGAVAEAEVAPDFLEVVWWNDMLNTTSQKLEINDVTTNAETHEETVDETWTEVANVTGSTDPGHYTQPSLTPGAKRAFRVTWANATRTIIGEPIIVQTDPLAPPAPTLTLGTPQQTQVVVTFTPPANDGATGYLIRRAVELSPGDAVDNPSTFSTITPAPLTPETPGAAITFNANNLVPNTRYYFVVRAVNDHRLTTGPAAPVQTAAP